MPCATYSKLYLALVQPGLENGAPVWTYKDYACIKAVQYRAGIGVGRYTPSAGITACLLLFVDFREYCSENIADLKTWMLPKLNHIVFLFALDHANRCKNAY